MRYYTYRHEVKRGVQDCQASRIPGGKSEGEEPHGRATARDRAEGRSGTMGQGEAGRSPSGLGRELRALPTPRLALDRWWRTCENTDEATNRVSGKHLLLAGWDVVVSWAGSVATVPALSFSLYSLPSLPLLISRSKASNHLLFTSSDHAGSRLGNFDNRSWDQVRLAACT
jgi:hypothetical protein